jgi:hypothetical protein
LSARNLHENLYVYVCVCLLPRGPKKNSIRTAKIPAFLATHKYLCCAYCLCVYNSCTGVRACASVISCMSRIKLICDWMDEDGPPNSHKKRIFELMRSNFFFWNLKSVFLFFKNPADRPCLYLTWLSDIIEIQQFVCAWKISGISAYMHCAGNIICMNKYIVQSSEGQTAAAAAVIISKSLKSGWAPGEGERAIFIRVYYTTSAEEGRRRWRSLIGPSSSAACV